MEVSPNKTLNTSKYCELFDISNYLAFHLDDFFTSSCILPTLLIAPTAILNALVLVGIYRTPSLHSPSNILLCGLALTDLGAGILSNGTFTIIALAYIFKLDVLWCDMNALSYVLAVPFPVLSYVTVALISIDRVIALRFHLRYTSIVTNRRSFVVLVFCWVLAFFIVSSHFWFNSLMIWSSVIALGLCLFICTVNNAVIFRILQRHRIDIERQHKQLQSNQSNDHLNMAQRRKTSSNMLWVYLMFIMCYAPFLGIKLYDIIRDSYQIRIQKTSYIALCLSYISINSNSLLNPIFYCIKMRPIRRVVFKMMPNKIKSFLNIENSESYSSTMH